MKDIKLPPIQGIKEQPPAQRPVRKDGPASDRFQQDLLAATMKNLEGVATTAGTPPQPSETKGAAIQDAIKANDEMFRTMMKEKETLLMLSRNVRTPDKEG